MTARISSHVYSGDFNIGLLFFCSANCFLCAGMSCRGVKFRGTIDVSNLSDKNDEDDLDICVALCKDQPNTPLLDLMKTSGVQEVRRVLGEYVQRLKSEFGQGMILPTTNALKQHSSVSTKKNEVKTNKTQIIPAPKCSSSTAPCPTGDRNQTCSFDLKETFQTNAHELYRTFISQEVLEQTRKDQTKSEQTKKDKNSSCRYSHAHQRWWTVAVGGNSSCWMGASVDSSHSWCQTRGLT
ncbi:activator of 90 kDa heat shock protein ATPase homolog 1-like isoform X4 [Neolamprologus brichardi]|uniref:activator of 90 kDa heat shock protein ATPase homolog 1-like isoform X4 n=1 Tax=Neolamprologus brichardi TaxID=32507 RepID=UPI001643DE1D|nr:activator of 90 kDa heat shock protein ATPase homolog 1-like isoform X4 [Neolamprologus brichardi]